MVSAVIATYNRSEYITEAIESARSQTYDDMEIIVVDDGSTDGTRDILEEYEDEQDTRVLYNDGNVGQCYSKNRGASAAEGKYLAFLDDDDRWHPELIARQVEYINSLGEEYGAVACGLQDVTNDGTVTGERCPSATGDVFPRILITNCVGPVSTVLFRTEAFEAVDGFADDCPPGNDWELYIRLTQKFLVGSLNEVLVNRRLHDDNISGDPEYDVCVRKMVRERYSEHIQSDESLKRRFDAVAEKERGLLALERGRRGAALTHLTRSVRLQPTITKVTLLVLTALGPTALQTARRMRNRITN